MDARKRGRRKISPCTGKQKSADRFLIPSLVRLVGIHRGIPVGRLAHLLSVLKTRFHGVGHARGLALLQFAAVAAVPGEGNVVDLNGLDHAAEKLTGAVRPFHCQIERRQLDRIADGRGDKEVRILRRDVFVRGVNQEAAPFAAT